MSEGAKVDVENMDDISSSAMATTTTMTEAIHEVMNNILKEERDEMNENEEANEEEEVMRITMSIPALLSLPLESTNTATTPEGNKNSCFHSAL